MEYETSDAGAVTRLQDDTSYSVTPAPAQLTIRWCYWGHPSLAGLIDPHPRSPVLQFTLCANVRRRPCMCLGGKGAREGQGRRCSSLSWARKSFKGAVCCSGLAAGGLSRGAGTPFGGKACKAGMLPAEKQARRTQLGPGGGCVHEPSACANLQGSRMLAKGQHAGHRNAGPRAAPSGLPSNWVV